MGGKPSLPRENARESRAKDESPTDRRQALQVLRKLRCILRAAKSNVQSLNGRRITGPQLWALNEIQAHPGIMVNDVVCAMALHQSTVSNLIRKLVSTGLVRKLRDKDDARVVRLYVTTAGKRVINSARYPRNGILLETLQRLSFGDIRKLERNLDQLLQQVHPEVSKIEPKARHA